VKFDFIGRRNIGFSLSGIVIAVGMVALLVNGLNLGIDFTGGNLFEVEFSRATTTGEIRQQLGKIGYGKSVIQQVGSGPHFVIKTEHLSPEQKAEVKGVLETIGIENILRDESVTPKFSEKLATDALWALIVAFIAILIYITLRFEFRFGVCAIAAMVHDTLVVVGIYALSFREVTTSTVAAFLTILGYSLMDTMVVFDRIRENKSMVGKMDYGGLVNLSINQTLARSINTSLSTLIPVVALLAIGGETLKDFAFALTVGIVSGTYSTIFTASPLLVAWNQLRPKYKIQSIKKRKELPVELKLAERKLPETRPLEKRPLERELIVGWPGLETNPAVREKEAPLRRIKKTKKKGAKPKLRK
jgi:preprotein translocase subunit SecF